MSRIVGELKGKTLRRVPGLGQALGRDPAGQQYSEMLLSVWVTDLLMRSKLSAPFGRHGAR